MQQKPALVETPLDSGRMPSAPSHLLLSFTLACVRLYLGVTAVCTAGGATSVSCAAVSRVEASARRSGAAAAAARTSNPAPSTTATHGHSLMCSRLLSEGMMKINHKGINQWERVRVRRSRPPVVKTPPTKSFMRTTRRGRRCHQLHLRGGAAATSCYPPPQLHPPSHPPAPPGCWCLSLQAVAFSSSAAEKVPIPQFEGPTGLPT